MYLHDQRVEHMVQHTCTLTAVLSHRTDFKYGLPQPVVILEPSTNAG